MKALSRSPWATRESPGEPFHLRVATSHLFYLKVSLLHLCCLPEPHQPHFLPELLRQPSRLTPSAMPFPGFTAPPQSISHPTTPRIIFTSQFCLPHSSAFITFFSNFVNPARFDLCPCHLVAFPWASSAHTGRLERCLLTCSLLSLSHGWSPLILCCWSVAKSCLNLCDPMDSSTPGFPVLHYLLEFVKTHVHWVSDATQPSHPLSPLLLLPSVFPSIRDFSSESALRIRWPKYWSFSFSTRPSNEFSGLTSFRMDWFDLLAVQGTL